MSNERFNDEILSAIIDGEADAETIASVNADVEASARLEQLRSAVQFVAAPVPDATPERRSASIAAAMAAATPAPEVSSLAAARHDREQAGKRRTIPPMWLAVAAAMLLFVVAVPFLVKFSPEDNETATTDSGDASLNIDDSAGDTADDSADGATDSDDAAEAHADDAPDEDSAGADEAMQEEDSPAAATTQAPAATDSPADLGEGDTSASDRLSSKNFFIVNNVDSLDAMINSGSVKPEFSAGDAIIAGVNPDCVRPNTLVTAETPYALINLTPFAGDDRLIYIEFADDGTTRILEAEDCAPLR